MFSSIRSEQDAVAILYQMRWPTGFICPDCSNRTAYVLASKTLPVHECRNCAKQTSITSGTLFEKTRTPLHKWLHAIYTVATSATGINAVQLAERISVTYKTAWSILAKIRNAISEADHIRPLVGQVELGMDIYLRHPFMQFREKQYAIIIASTLPATSNRQERYIKIKFPNIPVSTRKPLCKEAVDAFISEHLCTPVDLVSVQYWRTPRAAGIRNIEKGLFDITKEAYSWLSHAHSGISAKFAQPYLDEFCFRYNHASKSEEVKFDILMGICLHQPPLPHDLQADAKIASLQPAFHSHSAG